MLSYAQAPKKQAGAIHAEMRQALKVYSQPGVALNRSAYNIVNTLGIFPPYLLLTRLFFLERFLGTLLKLQLLVNYG